MPLVVAIIVVLIIYGLQQKLYLRFWNQDLKVNIAFHDSYVQVGEKSYLTEEIENAKFLPMPVFHVKFFTSRTFTFDDCENTSVTDAYHRNDVFSVLGNQKITRHLDFTTKKRGFYEIPEISVIAKDFFMTRTFAMNLKNNSSLYVFPKKIEGPDFDVICNQLLGEIEVKNSLLEDPFLFRGIREYMPGDSLSRMNWKATAKTSNMMVNQFGHSSEQQVKILLNLDTNTMVKTDFLREICISFASSAAEYFISKNIPVMISTNGLDVKTKDMIQVMPGCTADHLITINKSLARVGENQEIESFLDILNDEIIGGNNNISYLIISSYYKEDLLLKLDYMVSNNMSVKMAVPFYDIQSREFANLKRPYITGWEVKFDEV